MPSLPDGAERVQQALNHAGTIFNVELLPESTASAHDAAQAVGVTIGQIGKSIVFASGQVPVIAVVPGDRRVDLSLLGDAIQGEELRQLKADEVYKLTGFRIGGVSPFALPGGAIVVIDKHLEQYSRLFVAAGHPRAVVAVTCSELIRLSSGQVAAISV